MTKNRISRIFPIVTALLITAVSITSDSYGSGIVLETFNSYLFTKWLIRNNTKRNASKTYSIKIENKNRYLHAGSYGSSIQIAKKVQWNIRLYPILSWRWRVHRLPVNANEYAKGRNDSAAAVYVLFVRKRIPLLSWKYQPVNVLKYVWSSSLPVGRVVRKKKVKFGATIYEGRFIVLESGKKKTGKWIHEKRNVFNDYRKTFGVNPKSNPLLIAILSDSNDTKSSAIADYDDIVIKNL